RQKRNLLMTLLLSQGVPMLLAGDEMGRSQRGNNNAYCQDNEISWLDWSLKEENADLVALTARLAEFRRDHPVFHRRRWFQGRPIHGETVTDIGWFAPDGTEMTEEDWDSGFAKSVGMFLNGDAIPDPDLRGEKITDDSFLVLFNAHYEPLPFTIPARDWGDHWVVVLDTDDVPVRPEVTGAGGPALPTTVAWDPGLGEGEPVKKGEQIDVGARSLMVLRRVE
ncbi:MAG: isoamylase, partial [Actinomycetota bacterium]|nr:isoamylase [Actinomycetota bacterium]